MQSSKASSSDSDSSVESDNEQTLNSTARRNYLRANAAPNMRNTGIYNGSMLNQYRQQPPFLYQQQHQPHYPNQLQQQYYRPNTAQGCDNYAYSQCMPPPSYYGQYSAQTNFNYPPYYMTQPPARPIPNAPARYAAPIFDQNRVKYVKREVPNASHPYFDYQRNEVIPMQAISNGYNYNHSYPLKSKQMLHHKNSTATTLNYDYQSQHSMILNDVPTYEMTNVSHQQYIASERLNRAVSDNSFRFINIAALGGTANLGGSIHSIHRSNAFEQENIDRNYPTELRKGQINFLNFDKEENKKKCNKKHAIIIGLVATIVTIIIASSVLLIQSKKIIIFQNKFLTYFIL